MSEHIENYERRGTIDTEHSYNHADVQRYYQASSEVANNRQHIDETRELIESYS